MFKPYEEYKKVDLPWLDKIPSQWSIKRAKTLFYVFDERSNTGTEELLSVSQNYGVVHRKNINVTMFKAESYVGYKLCYPNDLVVNSLWAWQYGLGISKYKGIISTAYSVYRFRDTKKYNPKFYDYYTRSASYHWEMRIRSKGLWKSRYQLSDSSFMDSPMLIPPREEQNQIVRFLDWKLAKINKLIRSKKKQIALLNEQKQVIINNALTKGLDSHAKLKESGISGLGSIPSSWSVKPLKYWAKSNLQSLNSSTEADFEFDYLDISSVGFGYVKQEPVHYRFDEAPSRARRVVKYGDTIISTVRTYLRSMCFIDHDIEHCIVSTGFSVLSPIKETVLPEILSYALSSDYFVNEVIKNSIGVSYPAINDKKLLSLKVALPSTIEEQLQLYNEIKSKTTLLDKGILSIKQQVTRLEEYRTRLISDVVTGKVDVRDIEIPEYEADSDETIDDEIDDNLVLDEEDGEMEVE